MEYNFDENNLLFTKFIENSIFTERQIQIIYRIKNKEGRIKEISSGAYYREVKQSKIKIKRLFYSIMLMNLLNIVNHEQLLTLNSVISKISILSDKNHNYDKYHDKDILYMFKVIEELIDRMIYL